MVVLLASSLWLILLPKQSFAERLGPERSACAEELRKYKAVLLQGAGFFKPPNPASLKAVQTESKLPVGQKKLPVDPGLRAAAFEASRLLVAPPPPPPLTGGPPPPGSHPALECANPVVLLWYSLRPRILHCTITSAT